MNKIIKTLVIMASGMLFFACSESEHADMMPHYVYLYSSSETSVSAADLVESGETEATCQFAVKYGVTYDTTAIVEAIVCPDLSLVEAYNQSKSKKLLPFPETHVSFPTTSVKIPSGSLEASVTFNLTNLDQLEQGEYLLPVTIKQATASNDFPLHETKKTIYYLVSNISDIVMTGKWEFEDATDLGKATIGNPLQLVGNGIESISGPGDGNKAVRVHGGNYLKCIHDLPATDGAYVGEYTLLMDIKYAFGWYPLYNTNIDNSDPADLWITDWNVVFGFFLGDGGAGVIATQKPLPSGSWNRLVISVKKGSWYRLYFNGELALDTTTASYTQHLLDPNGLLLFGDNGANFGVSPSWIDVSEVHIYNGALSESRIKLLGGARQ